MKITLRTGQLQEVANKAVKGSSRDKMLLITSAIGIELKEGNLILTTSDGAVTYEITIPNALNSKENFYACTDSELFCKLVDKTTTDTITLEITENALVVSGNGVFKLPLIIDEESNVVRIKPIQFEPKTTVKLTAEDIMLFNNYNKASVAKTFEEPCLTGYCIDENKAVSFNFSTACVSTISPTVAPILLSKQLITLMETITEDAQFIIGDNNVAIKSKNIYITATLLEGIEKFPVGVLKQLSTSDAYTSAVEVNKAMLESALDRLNLFVQKEEGGAIIINFTEDALLLANKNLSGVEKIVYIKKTNPTMLEKMVEINSFKNVIATIGTETISFKYGDDRGLLVTTPKATQIVSYLTEQSGEEEEVATEVVESEAAPFEEEIDGNA